MDIIYFIKMCLVGFIQGITEPLPISSSAHMVIFKELLNIHINDLNFEILINFASCLAVIVFFRKKIFYLLKNVFTNKKDNYPHLNRTFFLKLIIASIPIAISGILLKGVVESLFSSLLFIGICLIVTSLLLFGTSLMLKKKKLMTDQISYIDSIVIGMFQSIAILPGISRSGTTFFSGTSRNIMLNHLFDFSFFLYLIASFGSLILSLFDLNIISFLKTQNIFTIMCVVIITFVSTLLSISFFYKTLSRKLISFFFFYTFLLGIFLLLINLLLLLPIQY